MPKCPCNNCSVEIEFHENMAGKTETCPKCGLETILFIKVKPEKVDFAPAPTFISEPDNIVYLRRIRTNTCYRALRSFIECVFVLAAFILIVSLILVIMYALSERSQGFTVGLWLIGTLVCGFALIAWNQASLLLIDIADSLLEKHSRDANKTPTAKRDTN